MMKKTIYIIILIIIGSQLMISCSAGNKITNQFAKRKYLKKYKSKKVENQPVYQVAFNEDNSTEVDFKAFKTEEVDEINESTIDESGGELFAQATTVVKPEKDNSQIVKTHFTNPFKKYLKKFKVKDDEPIKEEKDAVSKRAYISLVFGILGIFFSPLLFGSIHAIIMGFRALRGISKSPDMYDEKTKRAAKTGIILGMIGTVLFLTFIAGVLVWFNSDEFSNRIM